MKKNDKNHKRGKSSNYMQIKLYDKDLETQYRVSKGRASPDELATYHNVIRTELRIKNGKLKSDKYEKSKIDKIVKKDLHTYYNAETTTKLYNDNVKPIFGTNDFYRIDEALKIIRKSSLKPKMKDKLCEFIKLINKYGYTQAEKIWLKTVSRNTLNNHKNRIESLGINLLTFDKSIDEEKVTKKRIKNFTQIK